MSIIIPSISWPQIASEAIAIQKILAEKVHLKNDFKKLEVIAGVDCSYDIKANTARAVVVLMKIKDLKPYAVIKAEIPTTFPYIPGLLSFREIPVILEALAKLPELPDLLMVDGQGVAHPRRLGIAAHLGVLTNVPSIGVAKSRLCGKYEEPDSAKGSCTDLIDKDQKIGLVLRSKEKTNPLFISAGHRTSHETALEITLKCLTKYRLPEPTRIVDKISKQFVEEANLGF